MGKVAPDDMIDAALEYVQACNRMFVCKAEPTDYADASATEDLATITLTTPDDLAIADDTSGRKITIAAKSGETIDHTGDATHIALGLSSDTSLRYVTTCTTQTLTAGGTVDVPAWKISISDPT